MKRRREEEKAVGPMFPRLHVNDAGDKGGPRAPPRNKMALYEQLSIPSQRFNPAATSAGSVSPRRRHCSGTLVTSTSSSQGYEHERSIFSPFYVPPHTPTHLGERFHSRCTDEMNLNTSMMELERRSITCVNNTTLNKAGLDAECSLLRPHESSSAKNSSCKKSEDEGDFRVPTFIQSGVTAFSRKDTATAEPERLTPFYANSPQKSYSAAFNSSIQFPNPTTDMKSVKYGHKQSEENLKDSLVVKEPAENSAPHPESGEKFAERSNFATPSSQQDHTNTSNVSQNLCYENPRLGRQSCDNDVSDGPRCLNDIDVLETGETLRVRNEVCLKASLGNTINSPNVSYKGNGQSEDKASGSFEMGDAEKTDEASEASMVDSIPSMEISPDDVVGVIGPKQFWKARRAIVNQQRVFAFQVFELHRLIKVQKLMAASPHLLLEGNPCLRRPPTKVFTKRPSPEHMVKSHLQTVKQKDDSKKPSQNTESPAVNPVKATPLPSREDGLSKGFPGQVPRSGPYSGTLPPVSMTPDNSASGWCLHPPPNQWLVPVMSPSEGLVYKPYTGPCPPTGSFVAPIYGSCAPLSLPPVAGDFMNTAYGATSHHQQNMDVLPGAPAIAPNYFPTPYGLPVVNPIISASAVEQVSPLAGSRRHGHAEQHSRSSCNMSNPKSEAFSICPWKFQASKDSELQGSTASSPCEKAREGRDALPLFPMAPTVEGSTQPLPSCCGDNQTRVIKVVPHNARSATESAARIFRSIQEERQQDDL